MNNSLSCKKPTTIRQTSLPVNIPASVHSPPRSSTSLVHLLLALCSAGHSNKMCLSVSLTPGLPISSSSLYSKASSLSSDTSGLHPLVHNPLPFRNIILLQSLVLTTPNL